MYKQYVLLKIQYHIEFYFDVSIQNKQFLETIASAKQHFQLR